MEILKETPKYRDGTRMGGYGARIQLDDGETIEICDAKGKLVVRVDVGVLSQRPTHCINVWIHDSRKVKSVHSVHYIDDSVTCVMISTEPKVKT